MNGGSADTDPMRKIFSKDTLTALLLALLIIGLIIMTADDAPTWIYQGF